MKFIKFAYVNKLARLSSNLFLRTGVKSAYWLFSCLYFLFLKFHFIHCISYFWFRLVLFGCFLLDLALVFRGYVLFWSFISRVDFIEFIFFNCRLCLIFYICLWRFLFLISYNWVLYCWHILSFDYLLNFHVYHWFFIVFVHWYAVLFSIQFFSTDFVSLFWPFLLFVWLD